MADRIYFALTQTWLCYCLADRTVLHHTHTHTIIYGRIHVEYSTDSLKQLLINFNKFSEWSSLTPYQEINFS